MKTSVGSKLTRRGAVVLVLILLIAVAGGVGIGVLKTTSLLMVEEFREMEEIQDLRFSINQLKNCFQKDLDNGSPRVGDKIDSFVANVLTNVESSKKALTERHNSTILDSITYTISRMNIKSLSFPHGITDWHVQIQSLNDHQIIDNLNNHLVDLENILQETKIEVDKYVLLNYKAITHSRITIMSLILIVFLVILLGGMVFIRSLTKPITQLLFSIEDVTQGNFRAVTNISSKDEFGQLAKAFNAMVARIDEVTVSRNHFDNIFNSMHDGLIVTNLEGRVTAINKSGANILELGQGSYLGSNIKTWFKSDWSPPIKNSGHQSIESETVLVTSKEKEVWVLFAISMLKDYSNSLIGCVTGFHDLTEKKRYEEKVIYAQQEKALAILDAQENERFRLAMELHDGIGQTLTFANYALESLAEKLPDLDNEKKQEVLLIKEQITVAISESRKISHNLIPLALHHFGLSVAFTELIGRLNHQTTTRFHFEAYGLDRRLNLQVEILLFRSCQEILQNVIKHAKASNAYVQLLRRDDKVVLICEDDGNGFTVQQNWQPDQGIGLETIRERVRAFNGNILIRSEHNQGTEITLELPCNFQHNEQNTHTDS